MHNDPFLSQHLIRHPRWRSILPVFLLIAATLLAACDIDRYGTNWPVSAEPHLVCPGENVTLTWDADEHRGCLGDGCPPPVRVHIESDPVEVVGGSLTVGAAGSQTAGPITGATSFNFTKTGGYLDLPEKSDSVDVVLPERETIVPLDFTAGCSGASAAWNPVDLSVPVFRSDAVRLLRVCNHSRDQVRLSLEFTSGTTLAWTLFPSLCTEELPTDLGRTVMRADASSLSLVPGGTECGVRASLPPDVHLDGVLTCDLRTTSAPIVAASPEPTDAGILIIVSPTPTTPGLPQLILTRNANCRAGPGSVYESVDAYPTGQSLQVDGRNEQAPWWWQVLRPDSKQHCWISAVAGTPNGDPNALQVVPAPPLPTLTPESTVIDFDKDGYPADQDCDDKNGKIHPGAPETPDDKVDSNCNGNDDQ